MHHGFHAPPRYIAYGKVKEGQCQHGPVECKYNRYINCAQSLHSDSWCVPGASPAGACGAFRWIRSCVAPRSGLIFSHRPVPRTPLPLPRVPYVQCLAKNLSSIEADAPGCAKTQGWDASELDACAGGESGPWVWCDCQEAAPAPVACHRGTLAPTPGARGEALELGAGEATTELQPALTNVPWVSEWRWEGRSGKGMVAWRAVLHE